MSSNMALFTSAVSREAVAEGAPIGLSGTCPEHGPSDLSNYKDRCAGEGRSA